MLAGSQSSTNLPVIEQDGWALLIGGFCALRLHVLRWRSRILTRCPPESAVSDSVGAFPALCHNYIFSQIKAVNEASHGSIFQ